MLAEKKIPEVAGEISSKIQNFTEGLFPGV